MLDGVRVYRIKGYSLRFCLVFFSLENLSICYAVDAILQYGTHIVNKSWYLSTLSAIPKRRLTSNSVADFFDVACVTKTYLSIDKHYLETERILDTQFRENISR